MKIYTHDWGDHYSVYINIPEGFCKLNIFREEDRKVADLFDVIVYPEYRGQGKGELILTTAIEVATSELCDFLLLWPVDVKWIKEWYARHGFALDARFRNYEGCPGWCKILKQEDSHAKD